MDKKDKLQVMWNDLPNMEKDDILHELQILNVDISYDELIKRLSCTYNDLQVADDLFKQFPINDEHSKYPKEFVDEAITQLARMHTFGFVHYGIISQDLYDLHHCLLGDEKKLIRYREIFSTFFHMCKQFKLDHFDALVYMVNDELDIGKEIVQFLMQLQILNTSDAHREVTQFVDRFFQIFKQMNPWIEEQLSYVQATSFIAMKSSKGDRMFQSMMKQFPDKTEVIYRYGISYQNIDKKKMQSTFQRYRKELQKDSEYYEKIKQLKGV